MEDKIYQVLRKHRVRLKKREELMPDLLALFSVSVSFNEGYEKGWSEATSEACKEIAKNYRPNER